MSVILCIISTSKHGQLTAVHSELCTMANTNNNINTEQESMSIPYASIINLEVSHSVMSTGKPIFLKEFDVFGDI